MDATRVSFESFDVFNVEFYPGTNFLQLELAAAKQATRASQSQK